ncbi:hypothetical protein ACFP2T_43390 [Plantactinospora solaniradicis]|uniref:Uncharacterized protein n=1 Tax=Plantactinospora solaniradicis TaxID=1723736 RepID=A0ABW1KQ35_9ACTN
MAYLNRSLTNYRTAVNAAYPRRDKTSDGWIGNAAHQLTDSDHNPDPDGSVDAWDMDVDLRSGGDSAAIEMLKDVFEKHPAARYWIHNRRIAHRNTGWDRRPYRGANPHDKHVHWNSDESREDNNTPWILGDDLPLTDDDAVLVARAVHNQGIGRTGKTIGYALDNVLDLPERLQTIEAKVDQLGTREIEVSVDAGEVAAALAVNETFLTALAKAVNDDSSRRMAA